MVSRYTLPKSPGAPVALQLPGVSHVKLPLKRCCATGTAAATLAGVAPHCATKSVGRGALYGEHPGDHHHQDFAKSTAIQMRGVLRYKWEEYWQYSLASERRGTKRTAIQIGGVLRYFSRSSGGWSF